jgi:CHAT domain-containing protein
MFGPGAQVLLGKTATESRFKHLAGDFKVLHLATHGDFNSFSPLMSGLELEADAVDDGLLQIHEILGLRLGAELVTLSACETALGSGYFADAPAADELVGLTRAFLAAGSATVMATLWEVDDRASVEIMKRFYDHLNHLGGVAHAAMALAATQRELRASRELGHPYFWAPFILAGANDARGRPGPAALGRLQ